MTISYNWLCTYLPVGSTIREDRVSPEKLGKIMTSIGLEVESLEKFESIKGGFEGLVAGKVVDCERHPNADKLSLTKVDIGGLNLLKIVCGATNVAKGQKVIVAPEGVTIYPRKSEPMMMRKVKIRGEESEGMICSEDEIGLSENHSGIMVLPDDVVPGTPVSDIFPVYQDWVYEIGLTPNRMDAMSHLGVARDICAWFSNAYNSEIRPISPFSNKTTKVKEPCPVAVDIVDAKACRRYAGAYLKNVAIQESPKWLQNRLISIGLRPINNIVDITNFILHETGQPLHAFDADKITGQKVIVQTLPAGTSFVTLDGKERKLAESDLMICDGEGTPMCIGGVFGGLGTGVTTSTKNIFLESAWFDPSFIRKTSFRHNLRTDAAARFEKGVDISQTVKVLKRAVSLILESGGEQVGGETDVYPNPIERPQIGLKFHYLKRLSGKNYHADKARRILESLGFEIIKEGLDDLWVSPPHSKPDIELQADVIEEIMRIDGYDNVEIPAGVNMVPSADRHAFEERLQVKISNALVANGFFELMTNSITNSAYYSSEVLDKSILMLNNLSTELNMLRPSMLESGLEIIQFNLNRKNNNLRLFEFGKVFSSTGVGQYHEQPKLALYLSGPTTTAHWNATEKPANIYFLKGIIQMLLSASGLTDVQFENAKEEGHERLSIVVDGKETGIIGKVPDHRLQQFGIKQPVWYGILYWDILLQLAAYKRISYKELVKFPKVERDLSVTVNRSTRFEQVEKALGELRISKLIGMELFDVFESEKLGNDKKSWAIHFIFEDKEKTLTDNEVDGMMQKIMQKLESSIEAAIRN